MKDKKVEEINPKFVIYEKKWYKNAWMWIALVCIFLTIFVFIGFMDEDAQLQTTKSQNSSLKSKNSKLKKDNDAYEKAIYKYLGNDSSDNSDDSDKSDSSVLKRNFGETLTYPVGENSKVEVTVQSAQRVSSEDSSVKYMPEKGFAEYVALTYTVKCVKGEVDNYNFENSHLSVTGSDGVIATGSSINDGPVTPDTLKEGQSFEFKYGYGLKAESPTLQVTLKNGQWTGDISQ